MTCWDTLVRRARLNWRYLGSPPWDTGISPPELVDFIAQSPPGSALDVGCGTGTNLLPLAKAGWQVAGVDLAWIPVWRARRKLCDAGFPGRVRRADVSKSLDLRRRFDLVLDIGCYHGLSQQGRTVYRENLKGWLAPGGAFLLYAHLKTAPNQSHGIQEGDLQALDPFLLLRKQTHTTEVRPNGDGGPPSVWVCYERREES